MCMFAEKKYFIFDIFMFLLCIGLINPGFEHLITCVLLVFYTLRAPHTSYQYIAHLSKKARHASDFHTLMRFFSVMMLCNLCCWNRTACCPMLSSLRHLRSACTRGPTWFGRSHAGSIDLALKSLCETLL